MKLVSGERTCVFELDNIIMALQITVSPKYYVNIFIPIDYQDIVKKVPSCHMSEFFVRDLSISGEWLSVCKKNTFFKTELKLGVTRLNSQIHSFTYSYPTRGTCIYGQHLFMSKDCQDIVKKVPYFFVTTKLKIYDTQYTSLHNLTRATSLKEFKYSGNKIGILLYLKPSCCTPLSTEQ